MPSTSYEEILAKDGQVITHVVGSSMEPLLHDRASIVVLQHIDRTKPRKGDVVLYKNGGIYILHRVLTENKTEYIIRGDNTYRLETVEKDAVLGVMTGFYRTAEGRLISRDNTGYWLYCLFLPLIRLVCRVVRKLKRVLYVDRRRKP